MREFHERISSKNGISKTYRVLGLENATKTCTKCGEVKSVDDFHIAQVTNVGGICRVKGRCKTCCNKQRNVTRNIIPEWPKPELCEMSNCKRVAKHPDHDHKTEKFRGWLCTECNTGFGKLGDNWQSAQDLFNYAGKHYDKQ